MNGLSTQKLPRRIAGLGELSGNLWWNWHQEARELFKALDRPLWKATCHNPIRLLQQVAPYRLVAAAEDPAFIKKYDSVMDSFNADMSDTGTWFHTRHPHLAGHTIAYFSMEFALHSSLPLYAGGLGVLAGDYCKEASDLGLPMVCIGFMYPQGYFRQRISDEGWQEEIYSQLNFAQAPVFPAVASPKQTAKVTLDIDSRQVSVSVWQVNVGRVRLYLLDTNLEENCPDDRQLTARLYAGDREARIKQEMVLGIGGVRILRVLGIEPLVWHANEGHTSFMMLERCREMVEQGMSFAQAAGQVQSTTAFTTHTPVPAGNDTFHHSLVEKYFQRYWHSLDLNRETFLKLGTVEQDSCNFNMTVLGLRMACHRNGVSQLHGAVCRRMWQCLWPHVEEQDVPVCSITNGIHVPTWLAPQMARLYQKYLGADWLERHDDPALWEWVEDIPDEELWAARRWLKSKLIGLLRSRARERWSENSGSPSAALAMGALLDTEVLTLGFARRFTDYKRALLVLHDVNRLKRLVQDDLYPIQIVFSGKAHPSDHHGKELIREIYNVARNPEFRGRIAFVEDYDMHLARYLVHGVDVWLNTPRTLQEASGTSGMKAGINGVPHLSVLDGWWYEGYNGANGWAIGGDTKAADPAEQDRIDAGELYHLLENRIIPLYYDRDLNGVPHGWIRVAKQAIRSTVPLFCARRMLKEYTERLYLPAYQVNEAISHEEAATGPHSSEQQRKTVAIPAPV